MIFRPAISKSGFIMVALRNQWRSQGLQSEGDKLKNIDQNTLVIFNLPRSLREKYACFIPTRDQSI